MLEEYTSNYISELFANFIGSVDSFELHDMDNDIKANGWGIKKITDVDNVEDFMTIFTPPPFKWSLSNSWWRRSSWRGQSQHEKSI